MKAIILAAGYAMRLRPLTENCAKPLLPVGGRPMIDYLYDKITQVAEVDAVHVVTNQKFAAQFEEWAGRHREPLPVTVHNDGTLSNDDRLGAIGDIQFTIQHGNLAGDDLLIIAGDNLFDFSLADYVEFWRSKGDGSCIALYRCGSLDLVREYSSVDLAAGDRVAAFTEKPPNPTSDLVGIAAYIYHRRHVSLVRQYLEEGNPPDAPGNFIAWLHRREPVYGYAFSGEWLDIGSHEQLLAADNRMRERNGLPPRAEYAAGSCA